MSGAARRIRARLPQHPRAARLRRELAELEQGRDALRARLDDLEKQKAVLREERLVFQHTLGQRVGKTLQKTSTYEKTAGLPSLLISHGSFERIWRKTVDLQSGKDEAAAIFADRAGTEKFLSSHDIALASEGARVDYVAHVFRDRVGAVQVAAQDELIAVDEDGAISGSGGSADQTALLRLVIDSARIGVSVPRPYIQVSWSAQGGELAATHVDITPTHVPTLDAEWDRHLGDLHELALVKIQQSLIDRGLFDLGVPGGVFVRRQDR